MESIIIVAFPIAQVQPKPNTMAVFRSSFDALMDAIFLSSAAMSQLSKAIRALQVACEEEEG